MENEDIFTKVMYLSFINNLVPYQMTATTEKHVFFMAILPVLNFLTQFTNIQRYNVKNAEKSIQ